MRLLTCFAFLTIGVGLSSGAWAEGKTLFEPNRAQLWEKTQDVKGKAAGKCGYIDNVPVIPVTKRTSNLGTAMTDILYYMNTVKTNGSCLFTVLTARDEMDSAGFDEADRKQLEGLGLNLDGKDTEEMGLTDDTAFLLMEKTNERMQRLQEEEKMSFRQTWDAVDVEKAANGQPFVSGSSLGVQYSSIVDKYLGRPIAANDIATNLAKFAASRGYKFDIKIMQKPTFGDVRSCLTNGCPLLLQCGAGQFFTVTGYLEEPGKKYLIVHDGVTATCKFDKTGMNEIIADDNIGNLKGEILPGIQFISVDRLSGDWWGLVIVNSKRDLSEERKIILENNGGEK